MKRNALPLLLFVCGKHAVLQLCDWLAFGLAPSELDTWVVLYDEKQAQAQRRISID